MIYKGYKINIEQDVDAENPREWDNVGTMVCFHSRYNLGDDTGMNDVEELFSELTGIEDDFYQYQEAVSNKLAAMQKRGDLVMLELYLYDHGGITMSCSPFSCPWDSGQVGFIYVTKETMEAKGITPEQAENYLQGEVEIYDNYLTGDCYWYSIEDDIDSCGCFYGYDHEKSGLLEYAENAIDCQVSEDEKQIFEDFKTEQRAILDAIKKQHNKVKAWIKHQVPLNYRTGRK